VSVERGPVNEYEVIWKTGHVDRLMAHQVSWPGGASDAIFGRGTVRPERVRFHAEVDGRWTLMLDAPADEISTVRNVTHVRDLP